MEKCSYFSYLLQLRVKIQWNKQIECKPRNYKEATFHFSRYFPLPRVTKQGVQAIILKCIRKSLCSNLAWNTAYPNIIAVFVRTCRQFRAVPTSFPVLHAPLSSLHRVSGRPHPASGSLTATWQSKRSLVTAATSPSCRHNNKVSCCVPCLCMQRM